MKRFSKRNQDLESDIVNEQRDQAKPLNKSTPDDLSVSLRAEMLPSSDIRPDLRKFRSFRPSPLTIRALLLLLLIIFLGWFLYFGPARPLLDNTLSGLMSRLQPDTTIQPTHSIVSPVTQTATDVASTATPTIRVSSSPTATGVKNTPTSRPSETAKNECVDVLTVTLNDVGKTLCVRGMILNFENRPSGFLIAFSAQRGSMYWVSYDLVWEPAKEGLCVETMGEVMQIANSPVLVFGYKNLPQICVTP